MMKLKKGFAVAMAAGVLTTGGLGVQATAFAQGGAAEAEKTAKESLVEDTTADLDTIPANVTLKIHKYDVENALPEDFNNHGIALKDTVKASWGDPLVAEFEAQKVEGIDLTKNEGWVKAEALSKTFKVADTTDAAKAKAEIKKTYTLGTATTIKTGKNAPGASLKTGLYLVTETKAPKGYKISVEPFLVTLPMTDIRNHGKWLSEINVYPKDQKNETSKPVKNVADASENAFLHGDKVKYTLSQKVVDGDAYRKFIMSDFYPSARLEKPEVPAKVYIGKDAADMANNSELDDTHFTIDNTTDGVYVIALNQKGLDAINAKKADGDTVFATFSMKVKENQEPAADKSQSPIINKFKTITERVTEVVPETPEDPKTPPPTNPQDPGKPNDPNDPNTPESFPKSFYGDVNIVKTNAARENLADVEFNLFECNSKAVLQGNPLNWTDANSNNTFDPGEETPIKTLADTDTPEIKGLLANDYRNGQKVTDPGFYCLVETKSLPGYELLAEPIKFQVLTDNADAPTKVALVEPTAQNTSGNGGFDLPLTGGKGVFALLLAGAAFLVLGRGYSVYAGRRKDA